MASDNEYLNRTAAYLNRSAEYAKTIYDSEGNWIARTTLPQVRERYWLSLSLYATGNTALADAVIRKGDVTVNHLGKPRTDGSTFDIFHSNIAVVCLKSYGEVMADDVRRKLSALVAEATAVTGNDRFPEFQFHGYNDNMPAKAAMGLILGGEIIGDDTAVAHGIQNLRGLRAMLVRRGTISEYNSPTYSAVTIHALAEIAEHSGSEEARDLARQSEARVWIDLAARFQPEIGCISGPYSRAYTVDLLATVTCISSVLWFNFGNIVKPSPLLLFENDPELVVHHEGDWPFNVAQMTWFAVGHYHIPERAAQLFERKTYPFTAAATYEVGDAGPDCPARSDSVLTYQQRDYTLGTAGKGWLSGDQCAPYFVTYKMRRDVQSYRDVATVYTKIVVDDDVPGFLPDVSLGASAEHDNLKSNSGTLTVQSESTAVVLTHPHLTLGSPQDTPAPQRPLKRLSELVIFPSHFGGADEVIVGGAQRESWNGKVASGEWIACRRGRLLIAILPIVYSRDFGQASIMLEKLNKYEVIRSTFYEGEERQFTRNELRFVCSGFVAEHASVDEYPSLTAFAEELAGSTVTDFVYTTRRTRYIRPKTDRRPKLDIETSWSPASSDARFIAVNGETPERPRVKIDGVTDDELPFLNEPVDSTATFPLPFATFSPSYSGSSAPVTSS